MAGRVVKAGVVARHIARIIDLGREHGVGADRGFILRRLGLAYRVLLMATRDMGFVQAKKYDLEVWAPGVERWLEVSSCSNFRDYQARRMAIRHRRAPGARPELVHTLNGSGLALARVVAAILETYQQPDGSVRVPGPLQASLGTDVLRPPA